MEINKEEIIKRFSCQEASKYLNNRSYLIGEITKLVNEGRTEESKYKPLKPSSIGNILCKCKEPELAEIIGMQKHTTNWQAWFWWKYKPKKLSTSTSCN